MEGAADIERLKTSPSHRSYPNVGMDLEVRWRDAPRDVALVEVRWPAHPLSAIVVGLSHPAPRPELDWYDG